MVLVQESGINLIKSDNNLLVVVSELTLNVKLILLSNLEISQAIILFNNWN